MTQSSYPPLVVRIWLLGCKGILSQSASILSYLGKDFPWYVLKDDHTILAVRNIGIIAKLLQNVNFFLRVSY